MKRLVSLLSVAALCLGFAGCSDDNTESPEVKIPVIKAAAPASVAATAHQDKIAYTIDNPIEGESIEAATTAEWIGSFDYATAGEVRFEVEANEGDARTATITLSYPKAQTVSVEVRQMAAAENIELSQDKLVFVTAGGDIAVTVTSGRAWTLEGESDWLTPSKKSGANGDEVVFTATKNEGDDPREAEFTFKCGSETATLTATQSFDERLIVDKSLYELDFSAQTLTVTLQANSITSCTIAEGADWIKPAAGTSGMEQKSFAFDVAKNEGAAREAVLTFTCGKVSEQVTVKQGDANLLMRIVDEKLREFVKTNFDTNKDGMLTEAEAAAVTELVFTEGATSAEGIEIFPNLTILELPSSSFTTVDLSKNAKLEEVGFNNCSSLESIDFTGCSELRSVNVGLCTAFTSVDLSSMPKLTEFIGYASGIASIDTSKNPELTSLTVYNTKLTSLDLSANTKLTRLNAGCKTLTSIDLSANKALDYLSLNGSTQLTSLDLSANTALTDISVDECDLKTLDIANLTELTELSISRNNHFEKLDISKNLKLKTLSAMCYPGDGEGTYYLYLLREQDDVSGNDSEYRVSLWLTFCCEKRYVEPDLSGMITDETFRKYCLDNFDADKDGKLTQTEAEAVTEINTTLASAEGIEIFTNLVALKANNSTCPTIDLSKNTKLEIFYMTYNTNLESVDLTGCTAVKDIMVSGCSKLTSIDTSNMPALEEMRAHVSGLTSFEAPNSPKLWHLTVYSTKISSLDLSNNPALINLLAGQTSISSLDLSANTALEKLDMTTCPGLTELDLSANTALKTINLNECNFKTLNTDNLAELKELNIDANNNLQKLDITKNGKLTMLSARCYPGDGEGTYDLYLLQSQEESVSLWVTSCCNKVYVEADVDLLGQIANWRIQDYVKANYDANGDGKLSQAEAEAVTKIVAGSVTDAAGIELFPNLEELELTYAMFSSIDLSKNPKLTSLNLQYSDQLTAVDLSANTALKTVNLGNCNLKTVEISHLAALETLTLSANNNMETLDISKNRNLKTLDAVCWPGGGDGSWTLRLLHSQDDTVSMSLGSCDKVYVD